LDAAAGEVLLWLSIAALRAGAAADSCCTAAGGSG
jgi:hypothetical protein